MKLKDIGMIKLHSFCFTSWRSLRNYIAEVLIIIDAGICVLTLGVLEINISVLYMELMQRIYGEESSRDDW